MTPDVLPELARILELAVIERLPNSGYIMVTPPPAWLAGAMDTSVTLKGAFPFLGHFLPIAGEAWHAGGSERRDSGPFEATINGENLLLRATALTVNTHRILVIEKLSGDADPRPILQRAREQMLSREQLERHVAALHAPAATISRDVAALRALSLSPDAQQLVENLSHATTALRDALAPLPAPPARHKH
jgi:hypothetical protein